MQVLDPRHRYRLNHLDGEGDIGSILTFVKRVGTNYPFNEPPVYEGTTSQEVIRALIDRSKYVDVQKPHAANKRVIALLREALYELENCAAEIRGDGVALQEAVSDPNTGFIELLVTCNKCGHIGCTVHATALPEFSKDVTVNYRGEW